MKNQLLAVLREGWEGPDPAHGFTYFLDRGPEAGLRETLARLSADEASRDVGGNSVAAHAHHLLFSFEAFGAFIGGDRRKRDWNESWRVSDVDENAWAQLQRGLAAQYETLIGLVEQHADEGEAPAGGSIGAIAHFAYHVGAIKQKLGVAGK